MSESVRAIAGCAASLAIAQGFAWLVRSLLWERVENLDPEASIYSKRRGKSPMAEDKDYFGEKLRLAERAREDAYFRKLDQALIEQMRQKDRAENTAAPQAAEAFPSILVPGGFLSHYS